MVLLEDMIQPPSSQPNQRPKVMEHLLQGTEHLHKLAIQTLVMVVPLQHRQHMLVKGMHPKQHMLHQHNSMPEVHQHKHRGRTIRTGDKKWQNVLF